MKKCKKKALFLIWNLDLFHSKHSNCQMQFHPNEWSYGINISYNQNSKPWSLVMGKSIFANIDIPKVWYLECEKS